MGYRYFFYCQTVTVLWRTVLLYPLPSPCPLGTNVEHWPPPWKNVPIKSLSDASVIFDVCAEGYASAGTRHGTVSVCPSVWPSVTPPHIKTPLGSKVCSMTTHNTRSTAACAWNRPTPRACVRAPRGATGNTANNFRPTTTTTLLALLHTAPWRHNCHLL